MQDSRWLLYAILAAVTASLVGILAKVGMAEINPILATALRSVVMMVFTIAVCSVKGKWVGVTRVHTTALVMILLSGIAGAASWLFGFEAYALARVSQVAPIDKLSVPLAAILAVIFLRERPSGTNWLGIVLIVIGAYFTALPSKPARPGASPAAPGVAPAADSRQSVIDAPLQHPPL